MRNFVHTVKSASSWLRTTALDPVGGLGILLATIGGILFVVLVTISLAGFPFNQYVGIFIWVGLPIVLLTGLVLVPIGRWRVGKKYPGGRMPELDFENPEHLKKLGFFLGMTVLNLVIFGFAGYGAYHYSETNEFCGTVCHTVMRPEWTAYQLSPHSRVHCVECHIGPGAGWFVRSKLSGARQVLAVATGSYERPIETPIKNLRPARETCEQCHWPEKFHGDKLQIIDGYKSDRDNTPLQTVLLLKVGGGTHAGEPVGGIHWHTNPANQIEYVSTDRTREEIPWIRLTREDGTVEEFVADGVDDLGELLGTGEHRVMDCIDCHNRPTHIYEMPDEAVDRALSEGRLDASIPYIRRNALRALKTDLGEDDDPAQRFEEILRDAWAADSVEVAPMELTAAARAVATIWGRNVFPQMDITWGTYPNFLGHKDDGGCFRCHDDSHTSSAGRTISGDCDTCHSLLAEEEKSPEILSELYGGTR